jgi:hypothetical protein
MILIDNFNCSYNMTSVLFNIAKKTSHPKVACIAGIPERGGEHTI